MTRLTCIRRHTRCATPRRGTQLVEFAVVAPVFFLMVLGMIEFGRAMMVQALMTNAAQLGARAGALDGAQATDVTNAVNAYLSAGGISGASTSCTPNPPSTALPGQDVSATVTIGFTRSELMLPPGIGG